MSQAALAESTEFYRLDANRKLNPKNRTDLGQFMTPAPIARYMASLFHDFKGDKIQLLDPGCGIGSLTAAFIEEFFGRQYKPKAVDVMAYEIDPVMLDYLKTTMQMSKILCAQNGIDFDSHIRSADFIEDGTPAYPRL